MNLQLPTKEIRITSQVSYQLIMHIDASILMVFLWPPLLNITFLVFVWGERGRRVALKAPYTC